MNDFELLLALTSELWN